MSDQIDRKEALKALREIYIRGNGLRPAAVDMINAVKFLPSAEVLTEEDYTELRDRFGEYVEFVVRDMIEGKGERWK